MHPFRLESKLVSSQLTCLRKLLWPAKKLACCVIVRLPLLCFGFLDIDQWTHGEPRTWRALCARWDWCTRWLARTNDDALSFALPTSSFISSLSLSPRTHINHPHNAGRATSRLLNNSNSRHISSGNRDTTHVCFFDLLWRRPAAFLTNSVRMGFPFQHYISGCDVFLQLMLNRVLCAMHTRVYVCI